MLAFIITMITHVENKEAKTLTVIQQHTEESTKGLLINTIWDLSIQKVYSWLS